MYLTLLCVWRMLCVSDTVVCMEEAMSEDRVMGMLLGKVMGNIMRKFYGEML